MKKLAEGKKSMDQQEKRKLDLAYGLLDLLKHNAIEKITVDQICRKAQIHRSTFYRHFQDKYDLLHHALDSFWFEKIDEKDVLGSTVRLIAQNKDVFRNISINNENNSSYWILLKMWSEQLLECERQGMLKDAKWIDQTFRRSKYPKLAIHMTAGALLTLFFEWGSSNYQMEPEELIEFIHNI